MGTVNQWDAVADGLGENGEGLRDTIHLSNSTLMVLDSLGLPLTRLWCLFEVESTPEYQLQFFYDDNFDKLEHMIEAVDVDNAICFDVKDKNMILGKIRDTFGSTGKMSDRLKLMLTKRLWVEKLEAERRSLVEKLEEREAELDYYAMELAEKGERIQNLEDRLAEKGELIRNLEETLPDASHDQADDMAMTKLPTARLDAIRRALMYADTNFTPPGNATSLLNAIKVDELRLALRLVGVDNNPAKKRVLALRLVPFLDRLVKV